MIFLAAGLIYFGATALAMPQSGLQEGLAPVAPHVDPQAEPQATPKAKWSELHPPLENEFRISLRASDGSPIKSLSIFLNSDRPFHKCKTHRLGPKEGASSITFYASIDKGADLLCNYWESGTCEGKPLVLQADTTANKTIPFEKGNRLTIDPTTNKPRALLSYTCTHISQVPSIKDQGSDETFR
jgi:hypothetical protein